MADGLQVGAAIPDGATIGPQIGMAIPADATIGEQPPQRTAMDSAGDFASELWKQVNPISGLKGAAQMAAHPIDTLKADAASRQSVYDEAEKAFKSGDYGTGAAKLLYSFIPLAGPQINAAANNFIKGNYAKGAGAATGMALNVAAPEAAEGALDLAKVPTGAPERMYESALKPSTVIAPEKRAAMIQTGLENAIPVTKGGLEKLGDLVDDLNAKTKATIANAAQQGATVNKYKVASPLYDVYKRFGTQVNPEADLNAVSESGNEFLRNQPTNIPAADAQAMKTGTYQQLRGKYGELSSASVESQKALARGIKDELINQFPELKDYGMKEKELLDLEPVLERAVNRISNHQIIGIGTPIAAGAAKAVTGSSGIGAVTGLLKAVVDDPYVKSKLAIALAKKAPAGTGLASAATRIGAWSEALGNAANGNKSDDQESAQ